MAKLPLVDGQGLSVVTSNWQSRLDDCHDTSKPSAGKEVFAQGSQPNMNESENEKRKFDELRMLYSACVSELASFKQHQWQVTNYGLLLYVGVVSLLKFVGTLTNFKYSVLYSALVLILGAGWFVLGAFDESIQRRRARLTEIRKQFTEGFRAAWRCGKSEAEVPDHPDRKLNLLLFFRVVLLSGFLAAAWIIAAHPDPMAQPDALIARGSGQNSSEALVQSTNNLTNIVAGIPGWYVCLALLVSIYHGYRGYILQRTAFPILGEHRRNWSTAEIICVRYAYDALSYFFMSMAGFLSFWIAIRMINMLPNWDSVSTGSGAILISLVVIAFLGITGHLAYLIHSGKLPK